MKNFKLSLLLALVGWASLFKLSWSMVLNQVDTNSTMIMILVLFFIIATMSSVVYSSVPKSAPTDIEVNVGGITYSEAKGNLKVIKSSNKTFVYPLSPTMMNEEKKK